MAYMLFEGVAMSVVNAYRDRPDAAEQLETAASVRAWIEQLAIDPSMRAVVIEPVAAVEDGLREALRRRARDRDGARDER